MRANDKFQIRFTGKGISPKAIPVRTLADALDAVQRLAAGVESPKNQPFDHGVDELFNLHLLGVVSGSAVYRVSTAAPVEVGRRLRLAGSVLENPANAENYPEVVGPLETLSALARRHACHIELIDSSDGLDVIAKIGPSSYSDVAREVFIRGETDVTGKVVRVGGATSFHCHLRLATRPRKLLVCRVVNAALIRQLGENLFRTVQVSGEATWFRRSWSLRHFIIKSIRSKRDGTISDAFASLRRVGAEAWNRASDPVELLRSVRGE